MDLLAFLVSPDRVSLGCVKDDDRLHQYVIPETYPDWKQCREECNNRRMKVAFHSLSKGGECGCIQSYYELDTTFEYEKKCKCPLPTSTSNKTCQDDEHWQLISVSNVIDLIDSEVGE